MNWLVPRENLTSEQEKVVAFDLTQHQVVRGSPGSGKTIVMLHRAKYLIDTYNIESDRFRILVFTNALKNYILPELATIGLPPDCVQTFDDWCMRLHKANIDTRVPWDKGPDFPRIRKNVLQLVKDSNWCLFDFVLIDEGQDLESIAYEILVKVSDHITVFMDSKQQLYENGSEETSILREFKIRRNRSLLDAYRCSPYVVRIASQFIRDSKEQDQFIHQNNPEEAGSRQLPLVSINDSHNAAIDHLIQVVRTRIDLGDRIAILFPTNRQVFGYYRAFQSENIQVEVPAQRKSGKGNGRLAHDFRSSRPKLMAYPSAKGLTFDTVMLPCFQRSNFKFLSDEILERWVFVAISRAIKWIYISAVDDLMYKDRLTVLQRERQLTIQTIGDDSEERTVEIEDPDKDDLSSFF